MTQKDKLKEAMLFASRVSSIASRIEHEGTSYDESWHKEYCKELKEAAKQFMKIL